jgi:formiminotetrahydrofolate cyclodeaminase
MEALARPQPDPGGGAAAAYGCSLALALLEKITRLELGRHPDGSDDYRLWVGLLETALSLKAEMEKLRQEDVDAYAKLSWALASAHRAAELAAAFRDAVACPAKIMEKAGEGLAAVGEAGGRCKKHLVADLQVACELLGAAVNGAYHIARANILLIEDAPKAANHEAVLEEVRERNEATYLLVSRKLASRFRPSKE